MDVADILPRNFTCLTSIIYGKYIKSREGWESAVVPQSGFCELMTQVLVFVHLTEFALFWDCEFKWTVMLLGQSKKLIILLCSSIVWAIPRKFKAIFWVRKLRKSIRYIFKHAGPTEPVTAVENNKVANETGVVDICSLPSINRPSDAPECSGVIPRWTYDTTANACRKFFWQGCWGTENLFKNEFACLAACNKQGRMNKTPPKYFEIEFELSFLYRTSEINRWKEHLSALHAIKVRRQSLS